MIRHHPSPDILCAYAAGSLPPGAALVVACHVEACPACARDVSLWEGVGGALLDETAPLAMSEGALDRALAALAGPVAKEPASPALPVWLRGNALPAALRRQTIGPRRWLTPSIWFAPVSVAPRGGARTYLVYGRPNTTLPRHTHTGYEYTAILGGGYRDALGDFDAGDFVETDESVLHAPGVTADDSCLCLISSGGPMKVDGLIARLVQLYAGELY
jgi:putative transcriptional regulator